MPDTMRMRQVVAERAAVYFGRGLAILRRTATGSLNGSHNFTLDEPDTRLNRDTMCHLVGVLSLRAKFFSTFPVGTLISERPPDRSERAQLGHSAPTLGV